MKKLAPILSSALIFLLITLNGICQTETETWSMFRGPNGSGVIECGAIPSEIGPEVNVIWKVDIPNGYSSPVLTDDFILLTGQEDESLFTYCLSRETGELVWKKAAPRPRNQKIDNRNNAASPSVASDEKSVYAFFNDFGLLGYDIEGNDLWQVPLGPFNNVYGMGASPIIAGENIILICDQNTDSYIIAVNKFTGKEVWRKDRPEATSGHSTPVIYQPEGEELQVLVPGSFFLTSYSAASGEKLWWVGGLSFEMKSTPVIWNDLVFINGYATPLNQPENTVEIPKFEKALNDFDKNKNGKLSREELPKETAYSWFDFVDLRVDGELDKSDWSYFEAALASLNGMLAIKLGGEGDMTEKNTVWTYHRSIPQLPSPLIYNDILYMINDGGYVTTFNPGTGDIIDKGRLPQGGTHFYASPVASDGKIVIISRRGKLSILEAGGSITPAFQSDFKELCFASPAISNGKVFVRTVSSLYCFGTDKQDKDKVQKSDIQPVLDSLCELAGYPGATFTVLMPDGESLELSYGYADLDSKTPMPADARMFSGSTGKTYVSAIAMQLIDEGKLDVESYVSSFFEGEDWYTDMPNAATIKVRNLLNHNSGIPRYVFKESYWEAFNKDRIREWPPKELLSFVAGDEPAHAPGEGWGYSDTGYLIIGLIIEKITGKPYYDVLVERIFKPFGLKNSSPSTSRIFPGLVQGYTGDHMAPYDLPPQVVENGQYIFNPSFEYTGGGVVSNSPDLAKWTKMLYEGKVFSAKQLKELLKPVGFRTGKPDKSGYGYGVFVYDTPNGLVYGHGGFFFGYETQMLYLPDLKCAIAMQVNADGTSGKMKLPIMQVAMGVVEELRAYMSH